jgi:predicted nucleic acid-binding protein
MVTATARIYRLTVVTRNVRDFDDMGVAVFYPSAFSPGEQA